MNEKYTWLNYAYGIRPTYPKVDTNQMKASVALKKVTGFFSAHYGCKPTSIRFAQNITTHVAEIVNAVKQNGENVPVLVDSHQVKYVKMGLESGALPEDHMTRPNYAPVMQMSFPPSKVVSFDPVDFVKNPAKYVAPHGRQVIVLSHVSRLTGEKFPIRKVYREIKKLNPNAILVVDGAQAVGAASFKAKGACDAYIGTNSKFIDAEPNLAPAYITSKLRKLMGVSSFSAEEMHSELVSTAVALRHSSISSFDFTPIKQMRTYALQKLKDVNGVEVFRVNNQAAHILTLKVKSADEARRIVSELGRRKVHVFHNLDWSEHKPEDALLRVSLGVKTTKKEIDHLASALKEVTREE